MLPGFPFTQLLFLNSKKEIRNKNRREKILQGVCLEQMLETRDGSQRITATKLISYVAIFEEALRRILKKSS